MNKRAFTLLLLSCFSVSLFAQTKSVIRIATVDVETMEPLVCVPVIADSFPNTIASMQFSVSWDGEAIDFAEARLGDNPFGFAPNDAMISSADPASFNVAFVSPTARGITIPPGTVVLELCFSREDKPEGSSAFTFSGMNEPEFGDQDTFTAQPFDTIPGSLTYRAGSTGVFTPELAEPSWGARVNIYPNPYKSGPVTISGERLPSFEGITVFDMEGRTVRHFKGDVKKINLSALPKGEYALQLMAQGRAVTRTLVKQ